MAAQKNSMKKKKTKEETPAKGESRKPTDDMSTMTDEKLNELILESCQDMNYLVSLIPADTYRVPDVAERSKPLKYQKKVKETVSEKVLRAEKSAKKKAKFAVDRTGGEAGAKEGSDSDEGEESEDDSEVDMSSEQPRKAVVPGVRAKTPAELKELLEKKMSALQPKRKEGRSERAESRKRKREEAKEKKKKQQEKDKKSKSFVPIPSPMPKEKRQRKETEQKTEDFTFGRMKMGGEEIVGGGKNKNKKYRDKPEKLLAKLEEKEKKLEMLGKDTEEGKAFMVKDDKTLLNKTIKKKQKMKAKTKEKWVKRANDIEDQRAKKAKEKLENIKKRAEDKKNKKMGIKSKASKGKKKK
ncbi:hypothetical protein GUITHDRAFT_147381 [Guillardia theta CCMP2712]|uniref:Ribosomal RNA-processing protein 14/surfeit locus protein 6 C-terminal domain-containing protein n=1 Tax=Guillardia theta (strain CCMP2712) TaxID=905079 RepID=L1IDL3_GUITC|nr:hypothetical protein GUITHDRAFT_147381 [Guillardia theta CCMP2712]EKX34197.1 hypothetical protein GUITHDRAFT_147381 [Guillardia theta CCMP2712]|eukprot:XP_005821177.1 hypothetical protein GUITHDRAFT_147381 [Guillardia theta CCMP2712]